jgi:hypothetical protein
MVHALLAGAPMEGHRDERLTRMTRILALLLVITFALAGQAFADNGAARARQAGPEAGAAKRSTIVRVALGAAAGFGVGMVAGLKALPDASCRDGRVWIAAGSFSALGAVIGYASGRRDVSRSGS